MAESSLPRGEIRVLYNCKFLNGNEALLEIGGLNSYEMKVLGNPKRLPLYERISIEPLRIPSYLESLPTLSEEIRQVVKRYSRRNFHIPGLYSDQPAIMGVINVTPDSFSDGGKYLSSDKALARAEQLIEEGADIIDIGGESTRPGSKEISVDEELKRVIPALEKIRPITDKIISIDTRKAKVAKEALDAGADWINDISGLRHDPEMVTLAAERKCPVVLMHMRGNPETMQINVQYEDPVREIYCWLRNRVSFLLEKGIEEKNIIIDPGIGFGKRPEDNLEIINRLSEFKSLGLPILIGPSRKSFIGVCTSKDVDDRLFGTSAAVAASVLGGAKIVRVHDVKEMKDVAIMAYAISCRKVPVGMRN